MAVDTSLPNADPGIASFAQESFGDVKELLFGDQQRVDTVLDIPTVAVADIDLPIFSVVDKSGRLAEQAGLAGTEPYGVTTTPISLLIGETDSIAVIRAGHLNMQVLNWDATFTTDAQKKEAFVGSESPTLFVSNPTTDGDLLY